jgi:hypothetical protein
MSSIKKASSFDRRRNYSKTKVPLSSKSTRMERMTAHQYEKTIKELLEKIEMLESRLVETGMDKIKIVTSHQKLIEENNILKREVKSSEKINKELNIKNKNSTQKIDDINRHFKDIRASYENKFELMLSELRQKSEDINDLVDKIKVKDNKILDMKINNELSNKEIEKNMNQLEMLKLTNKAQEQKINKLENEINKLYLEKKCEGNLLMENKHLKDDNIRLVELLSITEEFSNFGYLNQSLPGGIRYISEIKLPELPRARKKAIKKRMDSLNSWIPGMAYDVMLQFNLEHDLNMDEVMINELLGKLNQVFREKEEKNVTRISAKYQKQILNIMDKYGIRNIAAPYNVVEVEQVKKEAAKIIKKEQKNEELKKKREQNAEDITNFAKTATSRFFWNHKKKLDEEIFDLKEKLSIKTGENNKCNTYNRLDVSNGSGGFKTNYGSTADSFGNVMDKKMNNFFIERMIREVSSISDSFEELVNEYRNRVKDTDLDFGNNNVKSQKSSIKILKTSIDWLISSMKDILRDSKNQFLQMKK